MYYQKVVLITYPPHLIALIKKQYLNCYTDDSTICEAETWILQTQLSCDKKRHDTHK